MLNTQERQNVTYFFGTEIEKTAMLGEYTLFVVGVQPVEEIIAKLSQGEKPCRHIYLGTSQSFTPKSLDDWEIWDEMIVGLLKHGYWVTLDFDVCYAKDIHEDSWCEYNNFIPMISVKLPYIRLFNYNATLKIDDTTWGATNSGVWCHQLHALMSRDVYSDWKDYTEDTPV